jgi:UDP-glucuronate 4-epimerase
MVRLLGDRKGIERLTRTGEKNRRANPVHSGLVLMSSTFPRILLTGGAGFIGSHAAEALLRRKAQLTLVDNLDDFYPPERKKNNLAEIRRAGDYEFWNLDICEIDRLRRVMELSKPDVIIHLAARAGVQFSIKQPELYEHVNVAGTRNLLELARDFKIKRFLFGSSSSVYGDKARVPFCEDEVNLRPISPYAITKLSGETLCRTYASVHRLSIVALRFFSVYGPRQRPDLAIHKFTALLEAGRPLPIFGDGTAGRDYTYVDDIVSGILAALDCKLQADQQGGSYEVFNLGRSRPVKVAELVKMLERVTGRKAIVERRDAQAGDLALTWADLSKSNRFLAYAPGIQLEEGLGRFYTWYRRNATRIDP